jgi:hypothetical protein
MPTPPAPDPDPIAQARQVLHALVDHLPADVALFEALIILLRPWVDADQGQAQAADDGS